MVCIWSPRLAVWPHVSTRGCARRHLHTLAPVLVRGMSPSQHLHKPISNLIAFVFPNPNCDILLLNLFCCKQIPNSVLDKSSSAYKGHKLPRRQSCSSSGLRRDLEERVAEVFECRAEELAPGEVLALLCTTRRDRAHPEVQLPDDTMNFIPVLEKAWKELINEANLRSCHSCRI